MPQYANILYPVSRRTILLGKEGAGQSGTAVSPSYAFPMVTFTPVDKITYLQDTAWRNAMAGFYNLIQGVTISDLSLAGPVFGDGVGYMFANILGDYYQSVSGTTSTTTSLSSGSTIGTTSLSVAGSIPTGRTIAIGALGTTAEEVRTITNNTGSGPFTLTLNAPLYQVHNTGGTITSYSSVTSYTHNFSLLNSGAGMGGFLQAQPPTYTITDLTGVPATSGARQYAYTCLSEMTVTGSSTALVEWDAKATGLESAIAGTTPTAAFSSVIPQASWISTVTLGGTQEFNDMEWKLTVTRKLEPLYTNSGQQNPFGIARGPLTATMGLNFNPALDESEYLMYLNNTQPTLVVNASNGLSGTSAVDLVITAQAAAFDTASIQDNKTVFGYDQTAMLVANTTNTGPSGGFSPCLISLTNQVVNYG